MDSRPPRAAPFTGAAASKAAAAESSNGSGSAAGAPHASPVPASRKGTGVFIPSCMIKS
jgi:hypothetical protein